MNDLLKDNQHFDSDLQMASKTIVSSNNFRQIADFNFLGKLQIELEIKLQAYDRLMAKEQEITQ